MHAQTLSEFIEMYGDPDKPYPEIIVGPEAEQWPTVIVQAGDKAAIVQFMNVGADNPGQHLCIDVHPFADGQKARASVFGMEVGRRFEAFKGAETGGTSHGLPATALVSVLVGQQTEKGETDGV